MALCDALSSGRLYAAALDVTDPEPLPSGHPLWKAENALITPHISGFFHLRDTYDNIIDIFVNNMERFHAGLPLLNIVDFSTGYRKTNNKYDIRAIR
jgi:phosphoglycerate dehydrogenase-like enzyme